MRKEQKSDLPSKAGDSPSQKQDPLERRRLQNRLSQRNHRRKIRDRIAKLQERVIANELRAAATLNGWDQPYASSPFMSSHPHYAPYPEPELSFGSPDQSPLSTEPSTPFCPSYPFSNPALCSADISSPPGSALSGDSAYLFDSTCGDLSSSSPSSKHGIPLMIGPGQSNDLFHNPWCGGMGLGPQAVTDDLGTLGSINQAMIYVAPENALPQILQTLRTTMSDSKIIILVPPAFTPSQQNEIPSSMGTNPLSQTEPPTPMSYSSETLLNMFNMPSQHPTQTPHLPSQQPLPRTWTGLGSGPSSGTGTCFTPCPLQKQGLLPSESFAAMRI